MRKGMFYIVPHYNPSQLLSSFVYVFGYNGYCRLGLGGQQDALVPKLVPQVGPVFWRGVQC
jgi:hypothetical protein